MTHIESKRRTSIVQIGGSLGIAGTCIATAIFLAGIFRQDAAFMLSILPVILGGVGMFLSIGGSICHPCSGDEDTQPLAALFVSLMSLIFGSLELWAYMLMHHAAAATPVVH